jgi:hypothetical protein
MRIRARHETHANAWWPPPVFVESVASKKRDEEFTALETREHGLS